MARLAVLTPRPMKNCYRIVGDDEADVKAGKISQSPIARALISKEVGDVVNVHTPGGEVEYEIDDVSYAG